MRLDRTSFAKRLGGYAEATELPGQPILEGRLLRMVGLTLEAEGLRAAMGSRCLVINDDSYHPVQVEAEVMGFSGSKIFLMPVGSLAGIPRCPCGAAGRHGPPADGHEHARPCARRRRSRAGRQGRHEG